MEGTNDKIVRSMSEHKYNNVTEEQSAEECKVPVDFLLAQDV